jgi:hypothetical protein
MGNFDQINSATKYPSIETYHNINLKNGALSDGDPMQFKGKVLATEKVDGSNARAIIMPNGDWFIGSREEITYAKGDRIVNPMGSIVPVILSLVNRMLGLERSGLGTPGIETYYLEVYGHRIGGASKNYTKTEGTYGARLFDASWAPMTVLHLQSEQISSWRQHGGQDWRDEHYLRWLSDYTEIELTPRVGEIPAEDMPITIDDTLAFLHTLLPRTYVGLDETANGAGEGIVFRSEDRTTIAKARFQDYNRTIRLREGDDRPRKQHK